MSEVIAPKHPLDTADALGRYDVGGNYQNPAPVHVDVGLQLTEQCDGTRGFRERVELAAGFTM